MWHSWLIFLWIGWESQPFHQATMVKLIDASLGGLATAKPEGVLKPHFDKKVARVAKMMSGKNIDQQVMRDIKERFPEFTYVDCFVRLIGGKSLFDEIKAKKLQTTAEGKRLGSAWWHALRQRWQRINSPEAGLVVKNKADTVSPTLISALTTATSSNTRLRTSAPLISWLQQQIAAPSQKALIGLFRHSLSMHPSTRHLQTVIHIMKMVSKLKLVQKNPEECSSLSIHWDVAMVNWLSQASRAGLRDDVFLDQHLECVALVLNEAHVRLVREAADVKVCSEELRCLCSSSALGQRVYGASLAQLCQAEYLGDLQKIIAETLSKNIDEELIGQAFAQAEQSAMKWEYDLRCCARASVSSTYQNVELKLAVHDATSVASGIIMTWIKQIGVQRGCIVQLWFEKDILPVAAMPQVWPIAEDITKPINTARRMINEHAQASNVSSGDLSVKMMESQQQALEQVDASAGIEIALCRALASGPGEAKMEEELFKCLPDAGSTISLSDALSALERLQESALYKFSPLSAQSKLGEVLGSVRSLCRAQSPCFTAWGGNSSLKKLKDEILPLFLTAPISGTEENQKFLRGLGAAKAILRSARERKIDDSLDLSHIGPLCTYDWILSQEENLEVQTWLKSIWASAGVAGASAVQRCTQRASSSSNEMLSCPPGKKEEDCSLGRGGECGQFVCVNSLEMRSGQARECHGSL